MLPEIKSVEPKLKEILYSCVEYVHATKAALYLSQSFDLNDKKYELVTSYGYNTADRRVLGANDELVDRLTIRRDAFFINGVGSDQRFAEILFNQGNDRLLAAPLFSRGRLVGFIDMRDKAGKKPFDIEDIEAAKKIAANVITFLAGSNLYGLAAISLADVPQPQASSQSAPPQVATSSAPAAASPLRAGQVLSDRAQAAVDAARASFTRRQMAEQYNGRPAMQEQDFEGLAVLLPAALAIHGSVAICLTAIGHSGNRQILAGRGPLSDASVNVLQSHVDTFLKRMNLQAGSMQRQMLAPLVPTGPAVEPAALVAVLSAPVNPTVVDGVVLTIAFDRQADAQIHRLLQLFLRQIENAIDSALLGTSRSDKQVIAEKLLEPDFEKYPDLAEHSRQVAALAHRFARVLDLPATQLETIRLTALVHDVGLRLFDYERLYRKAQLSSDEMRAVTDHPIVGAALVEPLLGAEIATAVLRHHERVDGRGYPSRLTGMQIPLASRIVQICDAWIAMVSTSSYQIPISRGDAAAKLREGAGSQFDEALVERFLGALNEIAI